MVDDEDTEDGEVFHNVAEYFTALCPQLLQIGLTYDQINTYSVDALNAYISAYTEQRKTKAIEDDTLAWNIGRYVTQGVGVVLSHAFGSTSTAEYPSEPTLIIELDEKRKKEKLLREMQASMAGFMSISAAIYERQQPNGVNDGRQ